MMSEDEAMTSASARRRTAGRAFAVDAALVLVFAIIGRASHDRGMSVLGVAETAWPFLVALAVGWAAMFVWRAPLRIFPTAVCVWLVTVAGGMLLRAASGQGTALAFVIVAAVTLGVFLVGWRLVALVVRAWRSRTAARTDSSATPHRS